MSLRRVHTHVFSRPAVASSFDFSKSNFEVLELTIGCHIESSGRRSVRDAKPDVIATCSRLRSNWQRDRSNWQGLRITSRGAGGVPLEVCHIESSGRRSAREAKPYLIAHVFSRPAVASSFDFSKSNFEVLELTIGTLELTRTTFELTRTTPELTGTTPELARSTLEVARKKLQMTRVC
jgi:hypothetical protein